VRNRPLRIIVDDYDLIEVASIDSFPASDPPGWIETTANPCTTGDAAADKECLQDTAKTMKRARAR
jgi:hypothetical protein